MARHWGRRISAPSPTPTRCCRRRRPRLCPRPAPRSNARRRPTPPPTSAAWPSAAPQATNSAAQERRVQRIRLPGVQRRPVPALRLQSGRRPQLYRLFRLQLERARLVPPPAVLPPAASAPARLRILVCRRPRHGPRPPGHRRSKPRHPAPSLPRPGSQIATATALLASPSEVPNPTLIRTSTL